MQREQNASPQRNAVSTESEAHAILSSITAVNDGFDLWNFSCPILPDDLCRRVDQFTVIWRGRTFARDVSTSEFAFLPAHDRREQHDFGFLRQPKFVHDVARALREIGTRFRTMRLADVR